MPEMTDEVLSPSGRFRLTIQTVPTQPGRWNHSRGTVTRVAGGELVCDIQRNFGVFHHSFVVKDGREYLITGRSYMSQTIVDLESGREYEPPREGGFCWARCYLSPDGNTLAVDGCVWACPYEFRFFDFADLSAGWPELRITGAEQLESPSDKRGPTWIDAHTFECFLCDDDDGGDEPHERMRLQRRGAEMAVVEHWVSEAEQARRDERARADAEIEAWWEAFHTSDPMYLRLLELTRAHALPCDNLESQPGGRELTRWFRRVEPHAAADLHWDAEARTLRLQLYDREFSRGEELTFEYSVAGIEAAVALLVETFA